MAFPEQFVWGAATSAYQIEGGHDADGKGPSVWDVFCRERGPDGRPRISDGQTGEVACDHYGRWREDVALLGELGVRAYRLSISWPRVLPGGEAEAGGVNEAGLAFYDRLINGLLAAGIEPWVTLYHWDYPYALHLRGGWLNPRSPEWFGRYAELIAKRLGDRVTKWFTINEPQVFLKFGYGDGKNAPGLTLPLREQLLAAHHALLAHGRGVRALREHAKRPATVGWAPIGFVRYPADESNPADVEAARRAMWDVPKPDLWNGVWYADAVCRGHYPEEGLRTYGDAAPKVGKGEMELIGEKIDLYGVNIYEGVPIRAVTGAAGGAGGDERRYEEAGYEAGVPVTAFKWPVTERSLYWGPRFVYERYGVPVYVTENGLSNVDWVMSDGKVHDPQRVDYTRRYLRELRRAAADGIDVRGYFHWSAFDNFEWAEGYRERFGLIHVDFATGKRTIKESGRWYRDVIESNGALL